MVVCQNRLQGLFCYGCCKEKDRRRLVHGKKAIQIFAQGANATFDSPDGIGSCNTKLHVSLCWANISHVIYFSYSTITQNGTSRCQKNMAKIV